MTYDIFISYSSKDRPWVEALANNLKRNNYKVFLDAWEITGGRVFVTEINKAIQNCRKGIIVVTPNILTSRWIEDEYSKMMIRKNEEKGFTIIPVVVSGDIENIPDLKHIQSVDFKNPKDYRKSFYLLICALEDKNPGSLKEFQGELEFPSPDEEQILQAPLRPERRWHYKIKKLLIVTDFGGQDL